MNVIPIDRPAQHKSLRRSFAMCEEFLQRAHGNLILYPEGTRSCDGEIQTFKRGAGLLTVDLKVPLVPAHSEGAHNILAEGKLIPQPGTTARNRTSRSDSNQFDPRCRRGYRRAAVELLAQRIRGLSGRPPAGDAIGLPEEPVHRLQTSRS